MRYVTAVNRTSKPLKCTWGGIHYTFGPGKHTLPVQTAIAFRYQNPIKGSDDPETGELQSYVGIEDDGTGEFNWASDCSPVEWSKDIELFKRRDAVPVVIMDVNGLYRQNANMRGPALSHPAQEVGGTFIGSK